MCILLVMTFAGICNAQNINWRSLNDEQPNLAYLNFGYDFGLTAHLGYARSIQTFRPILLSADYSFPMGKQLLDDFKIRYGGQIEIVELNNFSASARIFGNFKRRETELVRIIGFGAELSALVGYYKPKWHIAAEFGFDKSITTHLKHSDIMRDNYGKINDGWYLPSGGHYFYGIQASKTLSRSLEISMKMGLTNAQGNDEDALLPYYFQLGLLKRF